MLHDTVALIAYEQPEVRHLLHYCCFLKNLRSTFSVYRLVHPKCLLAGTVSLCP